MLEVLGRQGVPFIAADPDAIARPEVGERDGFAASARRGRRLPENVTHRVLIAANAIGHVSALSLR